MSNADVVLNGLNTTAGEYGVTLSGSLTQPWVDASDTATAFKNNLDTILPLLTNESGVVTIFNVDAKQKLEEVFSAGSTAATGFKSSVEKEVGNVKTVVSNSTSELTSNLKFPWKQLTSGDSPINTFSNNATTAITGAITLAQGKASAMTNALTSPWRVGKNAMNTFSEHIKEVLDKAQREAAAAGAQISKSLNVQYSSYVGTGSGNTGGAGNYGSGGGNSNTESKTYHANVTLDARSNLGSAGYIAATASGKSKAEAKSLAQVKVKSQAISLAQAKGMTASEAMRHWTNTWSKKLGVSYYAKGSLSTKKDGLAVTDESWIGEEITLAAGKNGQLQYLKKGSAVMPADISANLVEWGKMNPNMLDMSGTVQGVNLMSNYVNKPELNLDFENLIRIDTCTEEALPAVKKLVQQELDSFARKLNYSLKRFAT